MRILLVADIHASDRPPSSCTDTYLYDLLELLMQTQKIAEERQVEAVVWAGDVFHSKAPSRTSHKLVQQLIDILRGYHRRAVYIVPGNHDMTNDHFESINATQPLGVLFKSGAARQLDGFTEYPIYGVPWQQTWDDERVTQALAEYREGWGAATHELVVAHAPLYPPGREPPYEYYSAEKWAQAMGGKGSVFYGHVHESHGVYRVGGVRFCNYGALSRGSLHEYNLSRQVGCTIWDGESGKFEFVPLVARPVSEVFRLTEKAQAVDMKGRLDEFLSRVGAATLESVSVESVLAHVKSQNVGSKAEALIQELLEEAQNAK